MAVDIHGGGACLGASGAQGEAATDGTTADVGPMAINAQCPCAVDLARGAAYFDQTQGHSRCARRAKVVLRRRIQSTLGGEPVPSLLHRRAVVGVGLSLLCLTALLYAGERTANGSAGQSNNFGSDNTVADQYNIHLNDGPIAEWSIWWGYVSGWTTTQRNTFANDTYAGFEHFEPLDVTVTKAADNTFQDVRMVPVAVNGPGNTVARTECSMDIATRYGTHHHRVCDRKLITIYQGSYGFSQDVRRSTSMATSSGMA